MSDRHYITKAGFQKLKDEHDRLFHEERPKLVETIAWAASNGDRSENADYIYGKRRLREIDRRLGYLSGRLDAAVVIDPGTIKTDRVVFGATVTLEDEEGREVRYSLVGEDEAEPEKGRLNWQSPIGRALIGKQVDDEVVVKVPSGERVFVVLDIQPTRT